MLARHLYQRRPWEQPGARVVGERLEAAPGGPWREPEAAEVAPQHWDWALPGRGLAEVAGEEAQQRGIQLPQSAVWELLDCPGRG